MQSQSVKDWRCYITDDLSTDDSVALARVLTVGDPRFEIIVNTRKYGQAGNYANVLRRADIDDDDICVCVDGDDWLPDPEVFSRVLDAYADGRAWMTWGSFEFEEEPGKIMFGCAMPVDVDNIREMPWVVSHLRTFRAFLFRAVRDQDLRDPDTGWYWMAGADSPWLMPMCEMAGHSHARYLRQVNMFYNYQNPACEFRTHPREQNRTERMVRAMPRYSRLERKPCVSVV